MTENLNKTHLRSCRVCLTYTSDDYLYLMEPLYEADDESEALEAVPTLLDCFNKCTQLQVTSYQLKRETWPARYLCSSCKLDLERAYHFINRAQLSDEMLKKEAESLNTKCQQNNKTPEIEYDEDSVDIQTLPGETCYPCVDIGQAENVETQLVLLHANELQETNFNNIETIDIEPNISGTETNDCINESYEIEIGQRSESPDSKGSYVDYEFEVEQFDGSEIQESLENCATDSHLVIANEYDVDNTCESESQIKCEFRKERRSKFFEFNCELCPDKFSYQRELMQHYDKEHNGDAKLRFRCDTCDKYCITKFALRIHVRQCHMHGKYVDCEKCGRMVLEMFYKIHLQKHASKAKFLCNFCPNTFNTKHLLLKHMEIHSSQRDRKIKCDICARQFYTMVLLQSHMEVHQTERVSYTCPLCPKSFMRQINLKLHMQLHRGETMNCPYCKKQFVRSNDLEIHIRFHTGNFPYACTKCDRRFAIKSHINEHMKKHDGVRYKCDKCDKEFINVSGLKQHSFEHTGMPYSCNVCKRGFPTKFKIRRHLRSVHKTLFCDEYSVDLANSYIIENRTADKQLMEDCAEMVEVLEEWDESVCNYQ